MSGIYEDRWVLVGKNSTRSLLVRGGNSPIAIPVSHKDSSELLQLLEEASKGIIAQEKEGA